MTIEELVEAHLAGEELTVPAGLQEEFKHAIAGHRAIAHALGEMIAMPEGPLAPRGAPSLPEDYEIVREIGHGGMGVVYLARQRSLGRLVAVKVLRPGEIAFGPIVRRFVEEARHLARLRHPNVVSIHETGQAGDEPYFTMDYIEGESLAAVIKRGPLSPTQALRILTQAAAGVEHAHAQGIIHRDLKPANILVDKAGHAFVTDFGLARDTSRASDLTGSGDVLGTPAYMSPEQANGETDRIGETTDVHALGVVLYEMLTGQAPYGHGAPAEVLARLLRDEPAPPRSHDRRIPRDLDTIVLKALSKQPEGRYATVRAFLEDLRRFEAGEPIVARRIGLVTRAWRVTRRYRAYVAVACFAVALTFFVLRNRMRSDAGLQAKLNLAQEQLDHGDPAQAVRLFQELYPLTDENDRWLIFHLMASGCSKVRERGEALDCWKRLLSLSPDAKLGKNDWLVASALVADLRAQHVFLQNAVIVDRAAAELAAKRLRMVIDGKDAKKDQRERAREDLALIEGALHPERLPAAPEDDPLSLPTGSQEAIEAWAADSSRPARLRAECMLASARMREAKGEREAALTWYRAAFGLLRDTSPIYSYPLASVVHRVSTTYLLDGTERPNDLGYETTWYREQACCRQLKEAYASLSRLAPPTLNPFNGGLVFHVEGLDRIEGLQASLRVDLWSRSVEDAEGRRSGRMSIHEVGLRMDGPARVGVADGTYRLSVEEGSVSRAASTYATEPELVAVDCQGLPEEVTISGEWIKLPTLRVRLLAPMEVQAPLMAASVDLRNAVFSWTPVPNATKYRVYLAFCEEEGVGSLLSSVGHCIESEGARACFGTAPRTQVRGLEHATVGGRSGYWYVEAYDAAGRVIARRTDHVNILLTHGLDDE